MATTTTSKFLVGLTAALLIAVGTQARAQERAGVVTTLEGKVTVMRASLPEPAPLRFKDDIFVKDRIATGEDSVARILLGGKAVVTVREHSVVVIKEVPGLSTIDVRAGRAAVAVAREKMRAGDLVEVRTPNAVAGIRGTVIVAEVFDPDHSVITVLKGVIDVKRLDGGRLVGHPTILRALQRVTVAGRAPLSAPQTVSPGAAKHLGQEFRVAPPRATPSAVTAAINEVEMERATRHLASISASPAAGRGARKAWPDDDRDGADRNADGADSIRQGQRPRKGDAGQRELTADAAASVKAGGSPAAAIGGLGGALKSHARGNGKHRDRDR